MPKKKHNIEFKFDGSIPPARQKTYGGCWEHGKDASCLCTYISDVVRLGGGNDR